MSFASQIISSVKNKSSPREDSTNTIDTATPQTTAIPNTSEDDIGFQTDINTEIKQKTPIQSLNNSSTDRSNTSSKKQSTRNTASNLYFPTLPVFVMGNYTIAVVFILLLILHHYNIEVFSVLGDTLDGLINAVYNLLQSFSKIFAPFIETVYTLLYGTVKETTKTSAVGMKKAADVNAEVVGDMTDPIINEEEERNTTKDNESTTKGGDIRKRKIEIKKQVSDKLKQQVNKQTEKQPQQTIQTDEADSSIQKSGWCYIGNDEGVRKCVNVSDSNVCMSGLVYKKQEDCLNGK